MLRFKSLFASVVGIGILFGAGACAKAGPIPTSGLVAYYPFNGNVNDESGNGNDLLFPGSPRNPTFTTDRFGSPSTALDFDGTDDYLIHGGSESVFDFTTAETFSAWINLDDVSGGLVLNKGSFGVFQNFGIGIDAGPVALRVYTADSVVHNLESTSSIVPGVWTHVAGVYDGTGSTPGLSLYINGVLDNFLPFSGPPFNNSSQLYVGAQPTNPGAHVDGRIDDIAIYNRALSASEVMQLVSLVPEPSSLTLLGIGCVALLGYRWRKRRVV